MRLSPSAAPTSTETATTATAGSSWPTPTARPAARPRRWRWAVYVYAHFRSCGPSTSIRRDVSWPSARAAGIRRGAIRPRNPRQGGGPRQARRRRPPPDRRGAAAGQPAEHYVVEDVCPFECCTYREWNVEEKIELCDGPAGAPLGVQLEQGSGCKASPARCIESRSRWWWASPSKPSPATAPTRFRFRSAGSSGSSTTWEELPPLLEARPDLRKGLWIDPGQSCLEFDAEECWAEYLDPPGTECSRLVGEDPPERRHWLAGPVSWLRWAMDSCG